MKKLNNPIIISLAGVVVILVVGGIFFPQMITPNYLLQQLQVASFLGIAAVGAMLVILLGHIDLSLPWTLTAAAIISCALSGQGIVVSLGAGLLVGIVDRSDQFGSGSRFLRLPSMIWTLAMNFIFLGISVFITGGFMPQVPRPSMKVLGIGRTLGIPNVVIVWAVISCIIILMLTRTKFGCTIYAVGISEKVAFLSGVNSNRSSSWGSSSSRGCPAPSRGCSSRGTPTRRSRPWESPTRSPPSRRS